MQVKQSDECMNKPGLAQAVFGLHLISVFHKEFA